MAKDMASESFSTITRGFIRDNGKSISNTAKDINCSRISASIRVPTSTEGQKGKECTNGSMDNSIKANG